MENKNMFYYTNTEKNDDSKLTKGPLNKQAIVFLIGWLGINVIAYLVSFITSLFVEIPNPEIDKEAYNLVISKITGPMQFITYFITLVALLSVLGLPLLKRIFKDFTKLEKIGKGIVYGFIIIGVSMFYGMIAQKLFPNLTDNENEQAVTSMINSYPVLSAILSIIFAPICEEITYRFGLFGLGNRKSKYLGFFLSSVVFALIHANFFVDSVEKLLIELVNLPIYMLSGFILSYAFYKEESLVTSMTAHAVNNLIAFCSSLLIPAGVALHVF